MSNQFLTQVIKMEYAQKEEGRRHRLDNYRIASVCFSGQVWLFTDVLPLINRKIFQLVNIYSL